MNNNGKTPILDLNYNTDYQVEIVGYKSGENDYGPWHFYKMEYNGQKYGHFALPDLHQQLQNYQEGDTVTIQKQQTEKDGYKWLVSGLNGSNNSVPQVSKAPLAEIDARTHDIHRQVCLKVAVKSFPASDRPWNDNVISELKRRTDSLMAVLEGNHDDLPF